MTAAMSDNCSPEFQRLAGRIGSFTCGTVQPVVHLRNPFDLSNWTLPVVEALFIVGSVLALVYAVRRFRRYGDPTNLAIWFGAVIYLAVTEPALFFARSYGLPNTMYDLFAHNVFTVQLVDDRIPLYIVGLYTSLISLAYEIVRALGVFRRNVVLASISVGFVHHLFYEIFDQLGPQLRWWIWNDSLDINKPTLASVPMTSVFIFAALGPAALTLLVRLFVGRKVERGERIGGWSLAGRTLASGVLVVPLIGLGSMPGSAVGDKNNTAQDVVLWLCVAVFAAIAIPVLYQQWRASRTAADAGASERPWFTLGFGGAFLATFAVLWITALPAYFDATHGITPGGYPIGSLPYVIVCFVGAGLVLAASVTAAWTTETPAGTEQAEVPTVPALPNA
jgi:hypothetical protein